MPTYSPLTALVTCPVVAHEVTLSRDCVFLDYILLSEGTPTCSNIHTCLSNYGDIKNITECLLHNAKNYLRRDDPPH
ncbi:MAG TPA: hypothetical protein VGC70_04770 [Burkholderiales bacterium]